MPVTAFLAVAALILVQSIIAGLCLYAYSRIRTAQDMAQAKQTDWEARVQAAVASADTARRIAESVETEHFRKLRSIMEGQGAEVASVAGRVDHLEASMKSVQTRLASEARAMARLEARASEKAEPPSDPAQMTPDQIIQKMGVPLAQPQNGEPAAAKREGFGRLAVR